MSLSKEELKSEIVSRAPWYQCITFPEYGLTTTDDPANAMLDAAWDNKIGEITLEEAARLRPVPKWNCIESLIPDVNDLDILEIGCNCGFFSFEFASQGAKSVLGLDVAPKWLENAEWVRSVFGLSNVSFQNCDFMRYAGPGRAASGLLSNQDGGIPLPNGLFDMVFTSTVLDHLFFPLFSIYKMLRISRHWVVIDVPAAQATVGDESVARLEIARDNSHHGFTFTSTFLTRYMARLGVPADAIQVHPYNESRNLCYVIDVSGMKGHLVGG